MADRFTDAEWDQLGEILTSAERQLIEMLRQRDRKRDYDFRITIAIEARTWEVAITEIYDLSERTKRGSRGVGLTFNEAWDGMGPVRGMKSPLR